ncbi:MAG: recombination regulator RecX [Pseudomonadota bacterium]
MAFGAVSLKGRALRYLSQREHSRTELQRKLARHEETPGELAQVLDDLAAKDFISEARVVDSVVHLRAPRLGAARIRQELQAKGIAPEAVQEALARLRSTEFPRARDLWRRRFDAPPADAAARAKQARFLMARGFSSDVVRKVLAGGWEEETD